MAARITWTLSDYNNGFTLQTAEEIMCTLIAKEGANRVTVLTGLPCCLSVEQVTPSIPKVTRENGWSEMYVGEVCVEVPKWAHWLAEASQQKAVESIPDTCRGKRVFFQDVSDKFQDPDGVG